MTSPIMTVHLYFNDEIGYKTQLFARNKSLEYNKSYVIRRFCTDANYSSNPIVAFTTASGIDCNNSDILCDEFYKCVIITGSDCVSSSGQGYYLYYLSLLILLFTFLLFVIFF